METLQVGRATITWLQGGVNFLDGGAMFGVVPKALWSKKYPHNDCNLLELRTDPLLLQIDGRNILVDTGMGHDKLTAKQIRNYGVLEDSFLEASLAKLQMVPEDIDLIIMTHLHYDHASGLTKKEHNTFIPTFPDIPIYTSQIEWDEMQAPNMRSKNTYWKMNWEAIQHQVQTFSDYIEIVKGLKLIHTGGHSDGHCILIFEDEDDCFIHMADLMPTHAHQNKLWVLAYDDYPMTSIYEKEKWMAYGYERGAWFTFYHDAYYRALKFDQLGNKVDDIKRKRHVYEKKIEDLQL